MSIKLHDCEFITSAVKPEQYPVHNGPEIALVGRSNVGKSSLINALVNRKKLAHISAQPGRTQTINFFRVDRLVFVDLPGYGFAKVPETVRAAWKPMINNYLTSRQNLVGILMLVDIRHRPTSDDKMMAEWLIEMGIPATLVITKADKVSKSKHESALVSIVNTLHLPGIVFSAKNKIGKENLIAVINQFCDQK